jgi:WXG100 family type VII secretion target
VRQVKEEGAAVTTPPTIPDSLTTTYDDQTLTIEPGSLNFAADAIHDAAQAVQDSLGNISSALANLALSWTGDAADSAQDFATQWTAAMAGLYGTEGNPSAGVINQVTTALVTAAANYSSAESTITNMFTTLSSQLGTAPSGDDTAPIQAGTTTPDATLSAVAETNWTSVPS